VRVLWVLIGEWESRQRGRSVGNNGNEHGGLYCGLVGKLAQGKMWCAWLTVKGFEMPRGKTAPGLGGLEFFERASWIRTRSLMRCL
jgi:hypothetical protein